MKGNRINITLGPEHAEKLSSLARRSHLSEGTLARSLLSSALDEADPSADRITEILDQIPGALARTEESLREADEGRTIPLSEI